MPKTRDIAELIDADLRHIKSLATEISGIVDVYNLDVSLYQLTRKHAVITMIKEDLKTCLERLDRS